MRCAGGHPCGVGIRVACPATPCGPAGWARWALDRGPRVSPATPPRPPPRASRPDLQSARGLLTRTVSLPTGGDSSIHSTRRPDSEAGLMVSRPPRIQPRNLRTARAEPRGRALPTCSVEDARVGGFALQRPGWLLLEFSSAASWAPSAGFCPAHCPYLPPSASATRSPRAPNRNTCFPFFPPCWIVPAASHFTGGLMPTRRRS